MICNACTYHQGLQNEEQGPQEMAYLNRVTQPLHHPTAESGHAGLPKHTHRLRLVSYPA